MAGFTKAILVGNLVRNPELRYTSAGTAIADLSIAVNRRFRQGEELKEETSYFDVVAFGRQAENASRYLEKGRRVLIEGRLTQERWETEDGSKRSKVKVVASEIHFMDSGQRQGEQSPGDDGESQW